MTPQSIANIGALIALTASEPMSLRQRLGAKLQFADDTAYVKQYRNQRQKRKDARRCGRKVK